MKAVRIIRGRRTSRRGVSISFPEVTVALQDSEVGEACAKHVADDIARRLRSAPAPWGRLGAAVAPQARALKDAVEFPYGGGVTRMEEHGAVTFEPQAAPMDKAIGELLEATIAGRAWRP